jgi:hypothetical protein
LYSYNALLERLAEYFEDVPPELRAFVPAAHARVRQRPLARQRDRTAADPPHIRHGLMWGAEWAAGNQGRAPAGAAGEAEVTQALYEGQRVSSQLGRFQSHRQSHQLVKIK